MLGEILYSCFLLLIVVFLFFLLRNLLKSLIIDIFGAKGAFLFGIRKWEYYEDFFGSGDEKTVIHLRICQYTDILQIYDYDCKKFVNYVDQGTT